MKKAVLIALVCTLTLTVFNYPVMSYDGQEGEVIEQKIHCNATLDDDFADNQVIVVLTNV